MQEIILDLIWKHCMWYGGTFSESHNTLRIPMATNTNFYIIIQCVELIQVQETHIIQKYMYMKCRTI